MKLTVVWTILFYLGVAVCLWPLYVAASQVVDYGRTAMTAHKLAQLPPVPVLVAAAQAGLLLWAIPAAVMLFRKQQDGYAWLVVLLVLAPIGAQLATA